MIHIIADSDRSRICFLILSAIEIMGVGGSGRKVVGGEGVNRLNHIIFDETAETRPGLRDTQRGWVRDGEWD